MPGPTFHETRRRVLSLYFDGHHEEALDEIRREWPRFPARAPVRHFFEMCILGRLDRPEEALASFDEALGQGIWWNPDRLGDPDLDPVREHPGWEARVAECVRLQAATGPPPAPIVRSPSGQPVGTLIVLHGRGAAPAEHVHEWDCAVDRGWRVVAPYGTVPSAYERWAWDPDTAVERLAALLPPLVDDERVLVAGFSQGAGLAARLACGGIVDAAGAVMIGPAFGDFGSPWPGLPPVPSYAVIGEHDHERAEAEEILRHLAAAGWPVRVEIAPGHYHEYPEDFAPSLDQALEFLGLPG